MLSGNRRRPLRATTNNVRSQRLQQCTEPPSRQIQYTDTGHRTYTTTPRVAPVNNDNNNNHDNVYGAIITTKVIARVHPVHLMNVD